MIRILKSKPISSSIESFSHQFLQRCSVSGTAKGKGKLKAAGPLKRNKVTIRKGSAPPAAKGKGRGNSEKERLEKMYDEILNAPTPVRHLTAKQRKREAEREKMGLISKDRQRELEMLKKDKEKLGVSEKPAIIGTPGLDLITLGLVDENEIPKYELTAEDGKRLAKEYSRILMRRHRAKQAAESTLLRMKKDAIEALPDHLKAAALVPDPTTAPKDLYLATLTPPIEGYLEKVKEAAMRSSGKQKLR
ncbi:hypothetical protein L484_024595 [Morus notabilis]|uniref:Uncharacterized protein n=1 Tax=Morus notabilis TaxID=981085 RepID=W9RHT4_9ROSA|nr:uncharacterized protein LOC21407329 [Morus notabilis]XP_024025207.1 uncharacterized protein LOC21407329 [Morus notabilis]XP_024025208.1 uncharacterized protein LOC21407329 [Morus notabilis]EXB93251.1 hypothetical protein L484_024595 [Morus notabilis]